MVQTTAWVARNHNGTLIAWHKDMGNLAEEAMYYEQVTGNQTTFSKETFDVEPSRHPQTKTQQA